MMPHFAQSLSCKRERGVGHKAWTMEPAWGSCLCWVAALHFCLGSSSGLWPESIQQPLQGSWGWGSGRKAPVSPEVQRDSGILQLGGTKCASSKHK